MPNAHPSLVTLEKDVGVNQGCNPTTSELVHLIQYHQESQ